LITHASDAVRYFECRNKQPLYSKIDVISSLLLIVSRHVWVSMSIQLM